MGLQPIYLHLLDTSLISSFSNRQHRHFCSLPSIRSAHSAELAPWNYCLLNESQRSKHLPEIRMGARVCVVEIFQNDNRRLIEQVRSVQREVWGSFEAWRTQLGARLNNLDIRQDCHLALSYGFVEKVREKLQRTQWPVLARHLTHLAQVAANNEGQLSIRLTCILIGRSICNIL